MRLRALYNRHYSAYHYKDGRKPLKTAGPGEYMALMTVDSQAAWVWRKFKDDSGETGINCAVFRNEGPLLSSMLVHEACELAWLRWPGERLYTYVNALAIKSTNPGYCFQRAGWQLCRTPEGRVKHTKSSKVILELLPDEPVLFEDVAGYWHHCKNMPLDTVAEWDKATQRWLLREHGEASPVEWCLWCLLRFEAMPECKEEEEHA